MSALLIYKYENLVDWEQVSTSTTATQLISLLTNYPNGFFHDIQAVQITNNDATNAVYLGWSASVSSTFYWQKLAAGAALSPDEPIGRGALANLYVIAAASTPKIAVGIFA